MAAETHVPESGDSRGFRIALRLLIALAFGISAYLAWSALTGQHVAGCGPTSGCDRVLQSRWSSWLGIPVSAFALGIYAAAFVATFGLAARGAPARPRRAWAILLVCAVAILGAVAWFVAVQAFILRAFCPYCMTAHVLGAVASVWILVRAPVFEPHDKPWKVEKLVYVQPGLARRLYAAAIAGAAVLVLGQVVYRPKTFEVSTVPASLAPTTSVASLTRSTGTSVAMPRPTPNAAPTGAVAAAVPPPAPVAPAPAPVRPAVPKVARILPLYGGAIQLNLAEVPVIGDPTAPALMVSLHDYACHHCRIMHAHLAQVRRQWTNQLAIISLPMPLDPKCNYTVKRMHPDHVNACEYAKTALAVWRAAPGAMEQFDDWIFTPERPPPPAEVNAYASQLVGSNALQQALKDPWIEKQLLQGIQIYATNYLQFHQGSMPQLILGSNVVVGTLGSPADLYPLIAKQPGVRVGAP